MNKEEIVEKGEVIDATQDQLEDSEAFVNHVIYKYKGKYYNITGEGTEDYYFDNCIYDDDEEPKEMTQKELDFYNI